jgi:hypothetical protein
MGKTNNLKDFVNEKSKGPKQDSQNRLRYLMSEGGEPTCMKIIYHYSIIKVHGLSYIYCML